MIKLHICLVSEGVSIQSGITLARDITYRKSAHQCSMGPRLVDAQSMLRANWIWRGIVSETGNRVQSKLGASEGTTEIWLTARSLLATKP